MVYKFIIISSEEEEFSREFDLDENNTLLDFHKAIQEELEYDKSQMASFFTTNDRWEKEEEFTLVDMGSDTSLMEDVIIDDIIINENQKLIYIFDIFNERAFFIECIGEVDVVVGREYPICTQSQGMPPRQIIMNGFETGRTSDFSTDILSETEVIPGDDPDLTELEDIDDFSEL